MDLAVEAQSWMSVSPGFVNEDQDAKSKILYSCLFLVVSAFSVPHASVWHGCPIGKQKMNPGCTPEAGQFSLLPASSSLVVFLSELESHQSSLAIPSGFIPWAKVFQRSLFGLQK